MPVGRPSTLPQSSPVFQPIALAAPAKLNLYLHVTGKRTDGYHLLDALVAFADIGDRITIAPADAFRFTVDGPFAEGLDGGTEDNLVVRALRGLAEAAGRRPDLSVNLTKNLPVASGIGGGSSDAAACLRGVARLWGLDPADPVVTGIATGLGSDVPICVAGRTAFMGGIGTEIDPAPALPRTGLVLVNPRIPLPTPKVYRARTGSFSPAMRFAEAPDDARELARLLADRTNDLAEAAIRIVPEIDLILAALRDLPECLLPRMSGSGATCFGLFDGPAEAARAASVLAERHPEWWIASGRLVDGVDSLDAAA